MWLRDEFVDMRQEWLHYSSLSLSLPKMLPKKDSFARAITALRAVNKARGGHSLLVSHGPRPTYYGASIAKAFCPKLPHLAYSFNFTDLPQGPQRRLLAKAYKQPTRFVTYSTVERALYADYFDIAIDSIDMLHWAVHVPEIDFSEKPLETGRYICALGSQARDYKTLFMAMRELRNIKLVVVTNAESLRNLEIPENVRVLTSIPLHEAHNILAHSEFMVLPLRDSQVPCGHVTIVSSMFFKKAIIVTDSQGVRDYIADEHTGLFFEPKNPRDLAQKIESLWSDAVKAKMLSELGFQFANTHCTEKTVINYFSGFLQQTLREGA